MPGKSQLRLTRDQWLEIGDMAGWAKDMGFGAARLKFESGPGSHCVCPMCGHSKRHVRMMPCEKLTCPRCGQAKMENRYFRGDEQMSPQMYPRK
jgi:hypothetical protein